MLLQKRSRDAPGLADYFGFFGGGIEQGETPEEAMVREIWEELRHQPDQHIFLGRFEHEVILYMYYERVETDFLDTHTVYEGQYGRWFTKEDVDQEPKLIARDREIIATFFAEMAV